MLTAKHRMFTGQTGVEGKFDSRNRKKCGVVGKLGVGPDDDSQAEKFKFDVIKSGKATVHS